MAGILPRGNVTRQAQIAAQRLVAKDFAIGVQTHRGADIRNYSSDAKTKLVETELEMVRTAWLLQHRSVVRRFYCVSRLDRFQRSEIDRRLQRCLSRAKTHPAVVEALGSPITEGFLVSGNTNVNGASGEANLSIPIFGPKGKGTIYVAATKSLGRWNYSGLVLEVARTHQRIDLLQR